MTRLIRSLYGSVWSRVLIPLALVGANGFSLNVLAWEATKNGKVDLNILADSRYAIYYVLSAVLLSAFEMGKARRDSSEDDYGKRMLNSLQSDLEKHCKDLIDQGKIEEAYQKIDKARFVYNMRGGRGRRQSEDDAKTANASA